MTPGPATPQTAEHRFPPAASSVRKARVWSEPLMAAWGVNGPSDDVVLLISEMVTNAVRHGSGAVDLRLCWRPETIRIEVHDVGAGGVAIRHPAISDTGGRGLVLVDALATRWGVEYAEGGKTVWAELPLRHQ